MRRSNRRSNRSMFSWDIPVPTFGLRFVDPNEADVDVGGAGDVETNPKAAAEAAIVESLQRIESNTGNSALLAKLTADPRIRAILDADAQGRRVKITNEEDKPPVEEEEISEQELEGMTNSKLIRHLDKKLTTKSATMMKDIIREELNSLLEPIKNELGQLKGVAISGVEDKLKTKITEARGKYDDFDAYSRPMIELSKKNPELSPEELYIIAKTRAGKPITPKANISSERPGSTIQRPPLKTVRKTELAAGNRGFEQLMKEASARIDVSGFDDE